MNRELDRLIARAIPVATILAALALSGCVIVRYAADPNGSADQWAQISKTLKQADQHK
jgi:hypothetical protein